MTQNEIEEEAFIKTIAKGKPEDEAFIKWAMREQERMSPHLYKK